MEIPGIHHFSWRKLRTRQDMIDASPKTTVAALNGPALGGGAEVSLACRGCSGAREDFSPMKNGGFPWDFREKWGFPWDFREKTGVLDDIPILK